MSDLIPGLRMLLLQAVLLLLVLSSHGQDTTEESEVLPAPPSGACSGWMAGIPGHPGHNGIPGRDGRDGTPGEKGEKGDGGKNKLLVFSIRLFLGREGLLVLYRSISY